jgi:hypothetical protein
MTKFGIDLCFKDQCIRWDGISCEMRKKGYWNKESLLMSQLYFSEPQAIQELTDEDQMYHQRILDSLYERQDLAAISKGCEHLSLLQQNRLLEILNQHEDLFTGRLGTWPDFEVDIQLKPDSMPHHTARPYRLPQVYVDTLKKETQ